jgi:hypothetical protein
MRVFSSAASAMNDGWCNVVFLRTLIGAATELHSVRVLARSLPALSEGMEESYGECTLSKQKSADYAALMGWRMAARRWRKEQTFIVLPVKTRGLGTE